LNRSIVDGPPEEGPRQTPVRTLWMEKNVGSGIGLVGVSVGDPM